ncbi:MAG: anthranilate phosphoribosyltransferase [Longimicrobiales bacterium]|nr:anthranilate phosphoribosyltransferase [Longimicrobiales bacterium]
MITPDEGPAMDLKPFIEEVARGQALSTSDAERVFSAMISGKASPVQVGAILMGLRTRGVLPCEVAGGVRALRRVMIPVPAKCPKMLTDTCGTGGGAITTFNISTAAALVAAGMGVRIAKHGNRSFTSRSGSADVLEALGVRIQLSPDAMGQVLEEVGIVFMFAPLLHPAMRHVGPIRKELGITTIMNLLGPLTNPAGALRQMVGVAEPGILWLIVEALRELGHTRALVVHGSPGMDEMSPLGPTQVAELREDGSILEGMITPGQLGLGTYPVGSLAGGTPEENARIVTRVLEGKEEGGARAAVLLNAAGALYVSGWGDSLPEALALAREGLDSGAGSRKLEELKAASNSVG